MAGGKETRPKRRFIWKLSLLSLLVLAVALLVPLVPANEWDAAQSSALEESAGSDETVHDEPVPSGDINLIPETVEAPMDTEPLPMADVWFDDALFLGDSRMEGFKLYAGLPNAQYLTAVGATVSSVFTTPTERQADGKKITIMNALTEKTFTKAYIMLGLNELGWPDPKQFQEKYAKVIAQIREVQPEAIIYVESILPVTAKKDAEGGYINNARIALFNDHLKTLAEEKDAHYLDVASVIAGEDGTLPETYSVDGIHLQPGPCKDWLAYIKLHTSPDEPVEKEELQ